MLWVVSRVTRISSSAPCPMIPRPSGLLTLSTIAVVVIPMLACEVSRDRSFSSANAAALLAELRMAEESQVSDSDQPWCGDRIEPVQNYIAEYLIRNFGFSCERREVRAAIGQTVDSINWHDIVLWDKRTENDTIISLALFYGGPEEGLAIRGSDDLGPLAVAMEALRVLWNTDRDLLRRITVSVSRLPAVGRLELNQLGDTMRYTSSAYGVDSVRYTPPFLSHAPGWVVALTSGPRYVTRLPISTVVFRDRIASSPMRESHDSEVAQPLYVQLGTSRGIVLDAHYSPTSQDDQSHSFAAAGRPLARQLRSIPTDQLRRAGVSDRWHWTNVCDEGWVFWFGAIFLPLLVLYLAAKVLLSEADTVLERVDKSIRRRRSELKKEIAESKKRISELRKRIAASSIVRKEGRIRYSDCRRE